MGNWRLSFAGRLKDAKAGSENSLWLPVATAEDAHFLRGAYFADARVGTLYRAGADLFQFLRR